MTKNEIIKSLEKLKKLDQDWSDIFDTMIDKPDYSELSPKYRSTNKKLAKINQKVHLIVQQLLALTKSSPDGVSYDDYREKYINGVFKGIDLSEYPDYLLGDGGWC